MSESPLASRKSSVGLANGRSQIMNHYLLVPSRALEQRLPPRLIVAVPLDRFGQTLFETVARFPFQLAPTKGRIDGITAIVPEPVSHERDQSLRFIQFLEHEFYQIEVHHFSATAEVIDRARLPFEQ